MLPACRACKTSEKAAGEKLGKAQRYRKVTKYKHLKRIKALVDRPSFDDEQAPLAFCRSCWLPKRVREPERL